MVAEVGAVVAGEDLLQGLGWGAGCDGFGSDEGVRVAVADDLKVEVVGGPSAGEHGVQLLPGLLPGSRPCMVSAVTPWAAWMVVA